MSGSSPTCARSRWPASGWANGRAIRVDAIPERTFAGWVESVAGGTGSVFSLFPPDNATGNFVRIVQRLPGPRAFRRAGELPEPDPSRHVGADCDRYHRLCSPEHPALVSGPRARKGSGPTAQDGRAGRHQDDRSILPSTAGRAVAGLGALEPARVVRRGAAPPSGDDRGSADIPPLRIGARPNCRPPCPTISRPRPALPPADADAGRSPAPGHHAVPLSLADAIRRSLANVETVRANVAVRTAQVAQFDALKEFVPLVTMPQVLVGYNQFTPGKGTNIIFPDVTGGTPLVGLPGVSNVQLSRVLLALPLDPSGQITALPIAEEGTRAKLLMEQLVRRSQAALAIQGYFEAKQIPVRHPGRPAWA